MDVFSSSRQRVWWICGSGHVSQAAIASRTNHHGCIGCQPERLSAAVSARFLSGRSFHSALEIGAGPLLEPLGFRSQQMARDSHRFDYGAPERSAVVEINGCYWHDHRVIAPECPHRPRTSLDNHGRTVAERDEIIRHKASSHGLALLELWECQRAEWPARVAAFVSVIDARMAAIGDPTRLPVSAAG